MKKKGNANDDVMYIFYFFVLYGWFEGADYCVASTLVWTLGDVDGRHLSGLETVGLSSQWSLVVFN